MRNMSTLPPIAPQTILGENENFEDIPKALDVTEVPNSTNEPIPRPPPPQTLRF
jgi:hypothetical protein